MKTFDLIVIGTGSGEEVYAEPMNEGASIAIVEEGPFGGTCLNRGCIPSKMLIHSADVIETIRSASKFGIDASVNGIDWDFIINRVANEVDSDSQEIERAAREADNVEVFDQRARFVGEKQLEVAGETITSETIVIAAGTRPFAPPVPGLADVSYVTSDQAMRLPKQPRHLVVYGGGYIAAEMAHFFEALGTEVTIVQRGDALLRAEDEEVSQRFTEVYARRFDLRLNSVLKGARGSGGGIVLDIEGPRDTESLECDALLVAVGRVPNTDLLDVAATGVETDERGFIGTDEYLETNVPGIWALGDIVGRYLLKHGANLEAAYVAYNLANPDHKAAVDYHAMPHAIFASPQVGSVGATERQLREHGVEYASSTYGYFDTAYGSSIEERDGFVKVLADPESREILGCHIIGPDAATLIQEVANPMRMKQTIDAITQSIYVHPAMPEVVQRAFNELGV